MKPVRAGSVFFSKVLIEHSHDCPPPSPFPPPCPSFHSQLCSEPFHSHNSNKHNTPYSQGQTEVLYGEKERRRHNLYPLFERMLNLKRIQPAEC